MAEITALPAPRRVGPSLGLSIALVIIGVVIAIPSAVKALVPIVHTFATSSTFDTPGTIHRHLSSGHYRLFQETGSSFSTGNVITLDPSQVTVTGADGTVIAVDAVSSTESITRGARVFTAAVGFTITRAGDYDVALTNGGPGRVILARSFGDVLKEAGKWVLVFAFGGLLVLVGTTLGIVGAVRRASRNRATAGRGTVWPPSGWYPDPSGAVRLRYWDGGRWTDHFDR